MFAIIAAVIFGIALLLDLLDTNLGASDLLNNTTLLTAGLLCIALHLAGVRTRWRRGRYFRRR